MLLALVVSSLRLGQMVQLEAERCVGALANEVMTSPCCRPLEQAVGAGAGLELGLELELELVLGFYLSVRQWSASRAAWTCVSW